MDSESQVVVKTKRVKTHAKMVAETMQLIEDLKKQVANVVVNRDLINSIASIGKRFTKEEVRSSASAGMMFIMIPLKELDGFKDKRLFKLLELLTDKLGCDFNSYDYAEEMQRSFSVCKRIGGATIYVRIEAKLKAAPKSCKRVQVGVDRSVTETPRYEFVCD